MKLSIQNATVTTDSNQVVTDASLAMESGKVHVIMGPNGSGKSSLVNAIMGHPQYQLASGRVSIDGEDITDASPDKKAKKGIFLSQQYLPEIAGVTLGNFLYQSVKAVKEIDESILSFYKTLGEKVEAIGINKEFLSRELNTDLSGGEKKQSEIIQLLALEPAFALLDEIDSGVDVDSLNKVFAGIEKLRKGVSSEASAKEGTGFVLITHYTDILNKITPDKVHVMKGGKIVESGGKELVERIKEKGFEN